MQMQKERMHGPTSSLSTLFHKYLSAMMEPFFLLVYHHFFVFPPLCITGSISYAVTYRWH